MSNNYDNWERLVDVVLRREKDRRLALAESRGSSFSSSISSSFRFGPDSPFHHQNPPPEAYTVNLLGDKMGILGIEGKRWEEIGYWIEPAILDDMINRLLGFSSTVTQEVLSEHEILTLCVASRKIFISQPNFLELDAPVKICSNIHGHYGDLLRLFKYAGFPPAANYLFFGGYVDYGIQSIETICLLLAYKIKYPQNFFILRGNHERTSVNRICGLYDECKHRYNVRLWEVLVDCFDCLPVAAIINEKILCINGGLSTDLHNLDQIRNMPRPTAVPDTGLISDILWSVPRNFGPDNVTEILTHLDLDITRRDHEVVENGYRFLADRRLITIFSAPNFSDEFNNSGEILCIDDNLMCKIQIMKSANV